MYKVQRTAEPGLNKSIVRDKYPSPDPSPPGDWMVGP